VAGPPLTGEINTFNYNYEPQVDFLGISAGDTGWPWIPPYVPNSTMKTYLTFLLDSLFFSKQDEIDSVRLRLWTEENYIVGNDNWGEWPVWDVPDGDTIKCCIDHINFGDFLDVGDWTAGDYGDLQTIESKCCFITPENYNPETCYIHVVVTNAVFDDLNNGRNKSQFRIRFEIDTDMDSLYDYIEFGLFNVYPINKPTLLIYYSDSTSVDSNNEFSTNNNILLENYPNPFQLSTTIKFSIQENIHKYNLSIYNIKGQLIKTFSTDQIKRKGGNYNVLWNGTNNAGQIIGSGLYLCKLQSKTKVITRKLLLIK